MPTNQVISRSRSPRSCSPLAFATALLLVSSLTACDDGESPAVDAGADTPAYPVTPPTRIGGEREARVHVPADYDPANAYPLVLLLHGFGANGFAQNIIFGLRERTTDYGFVLIIPEGTRNDSGQQFWNAFPECCNFEEQDVDDVAYLTGLVEEAATVINIDRDRVASVGHSNGGYMSFRLACERPDVIRRVVSLAGAVSVDPDACVDGDAVSVIHIHGTADDTVPYDDNQTGDPGDRYGIITAGARETVRRWRVRNGCDEEPDQTYTADLLSLVPGEETTIEEWTSCTSGETVALWTGEGGDHIYLDRTAEFQDRIAAFVSAP